MYGMYSEQSLRGTMGPACILRGMELGADAVRVGDTHTCTVQGHKSASPVHACLFHSLAIGLDTFRLQLWGFVTRRNRVSSFSSVVQ